MNFLVFAEQKALFIRGAIEAFASNVYRLLKASPIFGGAVVTSGIVLGLSPALWWQYFSKFTDASFASRGVGTVTSDLTQSAFWLVGLSLCISVAVVYALQTKALARQIVEKTILTGIIVTHTIILMPVAEGFLVFLAILATGSRFIKFRPAQYALFGVIFLLATSGIYDVILMMTRRSMTVGSMMQYSGAIITLSLIIALLTYKQMRAK